MAAAVLRAPVLVVLVVGLSLLDDALLLVVAAGLTGLAGMVAGGVRLFSRANLWTRRLDGARPPDPLSRGVTR